ncbi:hypothetical protein JN01_0285 [Entomoplasma freundtii]|uniref:Uncharacterized protein n=1 Tax=Entomoplasma freundtii TaxID=74700 RepID=A0A2K8NU59_9MOLU|nr:hypothetical protein EFREU_v1c02750 [Entomoplasma freundtii]TDY56797.1 hypothetical protein JN01_0285 [Entomoplasma freundtii]
MYRKFFNNLLKLLKSIKRHNYEFIVNDLNRAISECKNRTLSDIPLINELCFNFNEYLNQCNCFGYDVNDLNSKESKLKLEIGKVWSVITSYGVIIDRISGSLLNEYNVRYKRTDCERIIPLPNTSFIFTFSSFHHQKILENPLISNSSSGLLVVNNKAKKHLQKLVSTTKTYGTFYLRSYVKGKKITIDVLSCNMCLYKRRTIWDCRDSYSM